MVATEVMSESLKVADGVAVLDGEDVLASPCARRIDALDLIGI